MMEAEKEKHDVMRGKEADIAFSTHSRVAPARLQHLLHMNGGLGDDSYANNSSVQRKVILEVKPILQQSVSEVYTGSFPECFKMADMGCSSGPNTFIPTWAIIEAIQQVCERLNRKLPMLQVFLNDLPGNDFNLIFRSFTCFYDRLKKDDGLTPLCFLAAVPGSFYGRLFPPGSLHFVHSSYSLHWLSQVPEGLVDKDGSPLNKGAVYITETSPPCVHKAYVDLFQRDFTTFLTSRSLELIAGGGMVLTFIGSQKDGSSKMWDLFGMTFNDMVEEGLIEEQKLDSFDMPSYFPTAEEAGLVIEKEGSFSIHQLETFQLSWDANIDERDKSLVFDSHARANYVAKYMEAVSESIIAAHFGDAMIDAFFERLQFKLADFIGTGEDAYTSLIISLAKK